MYIRSKLPVTFLILSIFLLITACREEEESTGLKDKYKDFFHIGAAVGKSHLSSYDTVLLKKHFSSLTAENDMKPSRTIESVGEYNFEAGDRILDFAERNDMQVRGHTLVWYNQTPDEFYRDSLGNYLEKEELLARLKQYITDVLAHYKGKVYAWDVVNEAIGYEDELFYREDIDWFRICGPEYIEKAFVFAREADPKVKLFYNDYNLIDPLKARKVYEMARDFLDRGIPIDGIGMQGHWTMEDVNAENLAASIDLFASLGLEVQITELDISVYPFYHNVPEETLPKETLPFTKDLEQKQADKYREVFSVLREKSEAITSVTFWGVADNRTWLSFYFVKDRTDYPLLFNADYEQKEAFKAIMDF
jgi:endo-1,4-beta-xylanase